MKNKLLGLKWLIFVSVAVLCLLLYDFFVTRQFLMNGMFLFTALLLLLSNILVRLWEAAKKKWLVPVNILLI